MPTWIVKRSIAILSAEEKNSSTRRLSRQGKKAFFKEKRVKAEDWRVGRGLDPDMANYFIPKIQLKG